MCMVHVCLCIHVPPEDICYANGLPRKGESPEQSTTGTDPCKGQERLCSFVIRQQFKSKLLAGPESSVPTFPQDKSVVEE